MMKDVIELIDNQIASKQQTLTYYESNVITSTKSLKTAHAQVEQITKEIKELADAKKKLQ